MSDLYLAAAGLTSISHLWLRRINPNSEVEISDFDLETTDCTDFHLQLRRRCK